MLGMPRRTVVISLRLSSRRTQVLITAMERGLAGAIVANLPSFFWPDKLRSLCWEFHRTPFGEALVGQDCLRVVEWLKRGRESLMCQSRVGRRSKSPLLIHLHLLLPLLSAGSNIESNEIRLEELMDHETSGKAVTSIFGCVSQPTHRLTGFDRHDLKAPATLIVVRGEPAENDMGVLT